MSHNNGFKAWGVTALAWLFPGFGHISLGRITKGLSLGSIVCALFFAGVYMGGHLQNLYNSESGILTKVFWFCNLGNGLLYLIPSYLGIAVQERPMQQYSEYGNVFLVAAGLLNYFLMLDAFDTAVGRKH